MVDQHKVGQWHRSKFPTCDPSRLVAKIREETGELSDELWYHLGYSAAQPVRDEAADIVIAVMAIADRCGFDLQQAINDKFARVVEKYLSYEDVPIDS